MTDREKQKALSLYRLTQAEENLDEARYLLAGGKSLRSVINRVYYGMFYSILGLLIYEPYASSKHSGVLSYFNKRFIGDGSCYPDWAIAQNRIFSGGHYSSSWLRMATEALAPIRLAPASIIARASASVRMPPAALTPIPSPTVFRINLRSVTVAPALP